MKADKVAIACFKKDLFLLRPCVASIRYWYPDVEIYLIKDYIQGRFSTREIETAFNVKIFPASRKNFGWPWSKLAVILHEKRNKYLFLDSDVVLLGKVLDRLNEFDDDFIVTGGQEDVSSFNVNTHYIDMKKIKSFDPSYQFPGFTFNGGHIVMTSGMLKEDDFESVIDFGPSIINKHPDIFKHGDQGPLNYGFVKAAQKEKIKLRYEDFWIWAGTPEAQEVDLKSIESKVGTPYVLHWAGLKPVDVRNYKRYDILKFYEDYYYSKIPGGKAKQFWRRFRLFSITRLKILKYKVFRMKYDTFCF